MARDPGGVPGAHDAGTIARVKRSVTALITCCAGALVLGTTSTASAAVRATTSSAAKLRATPAGGKVLAHVRRGTALRAECTRVGALARVPRDGWSRLWVRVNVNGRSGWIHDGLVNRDAHRLLVPVCGVPVPSGPAAPGQERGFCAVTPVVPLLPAYATREEFIAAALPGAVSSRERNGVPASVALAQATLESAGGQVAALGNNFFGIKAKEPDRAGTYRWGEHAVGCTYKKTREGERGGRLVMTYGAFRAYRTLDASIMDHGALLTSNPVYRPAFAHTTAPRQFAVLIARRYATDPRYAKKVLDIMDRYQLTQYDAVTPGA